MSMPLYPEDMSITKNGDGSYTMVVRTEKAELHMDLDPYLKVQFDLVMGDFKGRPELVAEIEMKAILRPDDKGVFFTMMGMDVHAVD